MSHSPRRRGCALAIIACAFALLAFAPGAFAASLSVDGSGNVVFTAAPGETNLVTFDQVDADTVEVTQQVSNGDDSTVNPDGTNCVVDTTGADNTFTCNNVTGGVIATADDQNDWLDAAGNYTGNGGLADKVATMDGGAGDDEVDGGDANDVLRGGAGDDSLDGGAGNDVIHGDDGDDSVSGDSSNTQNGNDQLFGDAGDDSVYGVGGNDTADGGDGNDDVRGGKGDDRLTGGAGNDYVRGDAGADSVDGGAGDDTVYGDCGSYSSCGGGNADANDTVLGGSGDDYTQGDGGADTIDMGSGIDEVDYPNRVNDATYNVTVTLDGVANDGGPGENDNVLNTEDVYVYDRCCGPQPNGSATLVGDAGVNALGGDSGNDTLDGGAGNDFLYGWGGNDTINANDGFADRVDCGDGTDVANVDEFDQVSDNCETVNRTTRGALATEDAPPTVAFTAPASGAKMSTKTANTLSVNATDDKGITQVIFLANERVICVVKTAPYNCSYKPTDADVGRTAITAVAYDTSQQTASAIRSVTVPRFTVKSVSFTTKPTKDTTAPFTFRTSGKVNLPAGVTKANGCKGSVLVTFKAGAKTISARRAKLSKSCTFKSKVTFTLPRRLHPKSLKVHVSFRGNAVLSPKGSKTRKVKVA